MDGPSVAHALKIQTQHTTIHLPQLRENEKLPDKPEGKVLWIGPGDCVVPPRGEVHAVCQMETDKPLRTEIFIVDTAKEDRLPAGTFITPLVLPSSAVDGNNIQVLVHNEISKEMYIPSGTVVAHVQWGKKVFSQPPIVQVLPLKKMKEACHFHHRYTSTTRDKIRKKNPENHIVGFLKNMFANYGGK